MLERGAPMVALAGLKQVGNAFGRALITLSPADTNRYRRAWAIAANEAGVGPFAVPEVVPSKYNERLKERLELQAERWQRIAEDKRKSAEYWQRVYENRYAREGRRGKWERDCAAKRDKAAKIAEKAAKVAARAREEADMIRPDSIVIWGRRKKAPGGKGYLSAAEDLRIGRLATVRVKVHGGTGYVVATSRGGYIILHNLEPHASIVEKNSRVVSRASAQVRRPGIRRGVRDRMVREIVKQFRATDRAR